MKFSDKLAKRICEILGVLVIPSYLIRDDPKSILGRTTEHIGYGVRWGEHESGIPAKTWREALYQWLVESKYVTGSQDCFEVTNSCPKSLREILEGPESCRRSNIVLCQECGAGIGRTKEGGIFDAPPVGSRLNAALKRVSTSEVVTELYEAMRKAGWTRAVSNHASGLHVTVEVVCDP